MLVDLLAELAHGQLALPDGVHEGRGQQAHRRIYFILFSRTE